MSWIVLWFIGYFFGNIFDYFKYLYIKWVFKTEIVLNIMVMGLRIGS